MTTITFGGGPQLHARMEFSNLKEGTQVPGYKGYIPQLKYTIGKTYGADTCDLSKSHGMLRSIHTVGPSPKPPLKNRLPGATGDNKYTEQMVPGYTVTVASDISSGLGNAQDYSHFNPVLPPVAGTSPRKPIHSKLPSANGDRKLINQMKPGYTGYIPRRPFKFGDTYKVDCDYCIDEHITNSNRHLTNHRELVEATKSYPRLQALKHDPAVRDHLNTYRDTHPQGPILMAEKRGLTEPPMPGYQGYIPRIGTTELGLGSRFHKNTGLGFQTFYNETAQRATMNGEPITIERSPTAPVMDVTGQVVPVSKRLYLQNGMIPKYTGYVPQRRYQFGNTYGNTTRSLDVCAHPQENFGEFIKSNPKPTASFAC